MSIQARQALVDSPYTFFRTQSQRDDLLDPSKTQTSLIALLTELTTRYIYILFTAVRSDHHNDSCLGLHCHANGYAADVWFLDRSDATAYTDADSFEFRSALEDVADSSWTYQIGLAGTANNTKNRLVAGKKYFADTGADHIHVGANL